MTSIKSILLTAGAIGAVALLGACTPQVQTQRTTTTDQYLTVPAATTTVTTTKIQQVP
jgi:hypothetical protein